MAAQIEMRMIQLRGKLDELNIPILNHIEHPIITKITPVGKINGSVIGESYNTR